MANVRGLFDRDCLQIGFFVGIVSAVATQLALIPIAATLAVYTGGAPTLSRLIPFRLQLEAWNSLSAVALTLMAVWIATNTGSRLLIARLDSWALRRRLERFSEADQGKPIISQGRLTPRQRQRVISERQFVESLHSNVGLWGRTFGFAAILLLASGLASLPWVVAATVVLVAISRRRFQAGIEGYFSVYPGATGPEAPATESELTNRFAKWNQVSAAPGPVSSLLLLGVIIGPFVPGLFGWSIVESQSEVIFILLWLALSSVAYEAARSASNLGFASAKLALQRAGKASQ